MSRQGAALRRRAAAHVLLEAGAGLDVAQMFFDDEVEHHLARVVKLRDGEELTVTDGAGHWRSFRARRLGSSLRADADGVVEFEARAAPFTIATAIPKGDRVEWMVQKTTELGVDRILLLDAERSVVRWKPDRAAKQLVRLQRIADEATRQSRRVWRTLVCGPVPASEAICEASIADPDGGPVTGREAMIAIGPEGGWSSEELASSENHVTLSDNILRVETAAVTATALRMTNAH